MTWKPLGAVAPRALSDVRKRLHRNVQWLARMAWSYFSPAPDDSHAALIWVDAPVSSLADEPEAAPHIALAADIPVRYEIVAPSLTARYAPLLNQLWLGNPKRPNNVFNLTDWPEPVTAKDLPLAFKSLGADGERFRADTLPYADEIPHVPDLAAPEPSAAAEFCSMYSNIAAALETLPTRGRPGPVRLWPRNFHLARRIAFEDGGSIVVGLAPDDATYDQPYFFVAPQPCGEVRSLPRAPTGLRWRIEGSVALVGTAEELMLCDSAEEKVAAAIAEGVAMCEMMIN